MAVGTDVLDRGGTGEAGDLAEGFDASETALAGISDDVVPVFAAHDFELGSGADGLGFDAGHAVDDDDAGEAFVVADGVGAIAEDKSGHVELTSEAVGIGDVSGGFYL